MTWGSKTTRQKINRTLKYTGSRGRRGLRLYSSLCTNAVSCCQNKHINKFARWKMVRRTNWTTWRRTPAVHTKNWNFVKKSQSDNQRFTKGKINLWSLTYLQSTCCLALQTFCNMGISSFSRLWYHWRLDRRGREANFHQAPLTLWTSY